LLAICRPPAVKSDTSVAPDTPHQQGLLLLRSRSQASQLPRPAARIKNGGNACHSDSTLSRAAAPHTRFCHNGAGRADDDPLLPEQRGTGLTTIRFCPKGAGTQPDDDPPRHERRGAGLTAVRFCPKGVGASLLAICRAPAVESDTLVAPDTPHQQGLLLLRSRSQASQLPRPGARIKNGGNACHSDSTLRRAAAPQARFCHNGAGRTDDDPLLPERRGDTT
jgi:hypothetical protein